MEGEMDGETLRNRRRALGYTQEAFGKILGLSADYIGQLERGSAPISAAMARAARTVPPNRPPGSPRTTDPLERIIEQALIDAGIRYDTDHGGGTVHRLDFQLPDFGVAIEVKRFHSERTSEQMSRVENVIVAQGEVAVRFLAAAIRSGDFADMLTTAATQRPRDTSSTSPQP